MMLVAPTVPLKDNILQFVRQQKQEATHSDVNANTSANANSDTKGIGKNNIAPDIRNSTVVAKAAEADELSGRSSSGSGGGGVTSAPGLLNSAQMSDLVDRSVTHVKNGVLLIGAASGFLAGLFGVGGGAVTIPALTFATTFDHHTVSEAQLCC